MRRLVKASDGLVIADAAFALAIPPPTYGVVPVYWNSDELGSIPELELEIWGNGTISLTGVTLYAAHQHPLVVADDTLEGVNATTNLLTFTGHGLLSGDGPFHLAGRQALVVADLVFTGEADNDTLTADNHGLLTGDGPVRVANAGGALPGGLVAGTDYWIIRLTEDTFQLASSLVNADAGTAVALSTDGTGTQTLSDTAGTLRYNNSGLPAGLASSRDYYVIVDDSDHIKLATTVQNALSGVAVDITGAGSGTTLLRDTAETQRIHWSSYGLLGLAGDGAIDVTNQISYAERVEHRPRAIAYALAGTLSTSDPEAVSAALYPLEET